MEFQSLHGQLWEDGDQKEHDYLGQVNAKNRQLAATGKAGTGSIAEVATVPLPPPANLNE